MRTQVGIVGAGPAGLMLSHLLHLEGIESVVLESRSRAYVEERVRAGVLEQGTVDVLNATGVGERMRREGMRHEGFDLMFGGRRHRIAMQELTGRCITVYGQQEVVKDLIAARRAAGGDVRFEVEEVAVRDADTERPRLEFRGGSLECDFVAGCDGFHGVCRPAMPGLSIYERGYPFAWLGILAEAPPASHELIYANHARGFALLSLRSPEVSRCYLQCAPDEEVERWTEDEIWAELQRRVGEVALTRGPLLQKGVTPMRSFVAEPMQWGRLFLAGDAAHIVPPTGAKGMNLAIADVLVLSRALGRFYRRGDGAGLEAYSATCLRRVWRAQHFSYWMTSMLHRFEGPDSAYDQRRQLAELDNVTSSRAAATNLAENYAGLPLEL